MSTDLQVTVAQIERTFVAYGQAVQKVATEIGRVFTKLADAVAGMFRAVEPATDVARFGPRNATGDGLWQTDMCASWLHGSCPSRWCDCTCHGGELR